MAMKPIDYLHTKQDLGGYSNKDLKKLYRYFNIPEKMSRNDKLWYLAINILHSTKRVEF